MSPDPPVLKKQRVMVDEDAGVLAFDETRSFGKVDGGCGLGCLAIAVAPILYWGAGLGGWIVLAIVTGACVLGMAWGIYTKPLERYVTLDREQRRFLDRKRNRFGWKEREVPFGKIGKIVFVIDYDSDCIEYEVHLGDPSIYLICEVQDVESIARDVADQVAAFTGFPIEEREDDAEEHPEQVAARLARLQQEAAAADSDADADA